MGPATAACKKLDVRSLPWNWTVFVMNLQEGISHPFAPLWRGPDGLVLDAHGIMLNVAPVSTHLGEKLIQRLQGNAWLWLFSFPTRHKVLHTCRPLPRNSKVGMEKTHFSKLVASSLAAKAAKKLSKCWRCLSLSGDATREPSTYPQDWRKCGPSSFEKFEQHSISRKGWTSIQTNPKGRWWPFWGYPQGQLEFGDTPWQDQF